MEVFSVLSKQPHIFRGATDASGYHLLNLRPTAAADSLAAFRMVGALAAYITWITGWVPQELSPIFFILALGGKTAVFDIGLICEFLPTQAAILETWPNQLTSSVDVGLGSRLSEIAIEYLDMGVCLPDDEFFLWSLTFI
jgi:hypothetical protein